MKMMQLFPGVLPANAPSLKSHIQLTFFYESGPLIHYWVIGMVVGMDQNCVSSFYSNAFKVSAFTMILL